jgi:hypothetical protein
MDAQPDMKVIGRQKKMRAGLEAMNGLLELAIELRGHKPFAPRGIYRFKSYEEADEWRMKMLTRASVDRLP